MKAYNITNKSGIYCIESLSTQRVYIGSSKNITNRIYCHIWHLINGEHHSAHLQNAFRKYGESDFIVFVLEYCDISDLLHREQAYFDTFLYAQQYISSNGKDDRFLKVGYNMTPTAGRHEGFKHSEETVMKLIANSISLWNDPEYVLKQLSTRTHEWYMETAKKAVAAKLADPTYLPRLKEANDKSEKRQSLKKCILIYDRITGEFLQEFKGIKECGRYLDISHSQINKVLHGRVKYTNDLVFKYKQSDNYPLYIEPVAQYDNEDMRKVAMRNVHKKNSKPILCYNLSGVLLKEYESASVAAKELKLGSSNIRDVIYGICSQIGGYVFKYKDPSVRKFYKNKLKK